MSQPARVTPICAVLLIVTIGAATASVGATRGRPAGSTVDDRELQERVEHATIDLTAAIARAEREAGGTVVSARYDTTRPKLEVEVVLIVDGERRVLRYDATEPDPGVAATAEIRARTGLRFAVLESKIRRRIISTDTPFGFKIRGVDADSAGARAGLRRGDVLLTFDGEPIRTMDELRGWLRSVPADSPVPITFARLKDDRSILTRRPWETRPGTIAPGCGAGDGPVGFER